MRPVIFVWDFSLRQTINISIKYQVKLFTGNYNNYLKTRFIKK